MSKRVSLHVLGLSYSQLQSGAYALVLAEDKGPRRIPVVIGAAEAQSIAICLEGIRTPRPMTHDLFVSFAHAFGVKLREVYIYRFEDGIFSSELTFSDGDRTVVIDARTSDAVAIAIRTGTPIFTTPEIVEQAGFVIDDKEFVRKNRMDSEDVDIDDDDNIDDDDDEAIDRTGYNAEPRPENFTIEQLEQTLAELIDKEEYEEAARI
ncbi:MAG: bifunctional nuclease family protein, partial [Muribaculaceae bacterium]|nr:bifunctional nuclease family protein [Muribaculaceae bacterium]